MPHFIDSREIRERLRLEPHPEGGYFREVYRSEMPVVHPGSGESRAAMTAIYFLLDGGDFSAWHRVRSDEAWTWLAGGPLQLHQIDPAGEYHDVVLGSAVAAHKQQCVVPANHWQAARPAGEEWVLTTCLVAPGFDFADFTMPDGEELSAEFPRHREIILELTRNP